MAIVSKRIDAQTRRIYSVLKAAYPDLSDDESDVVYKSNRYSIRVRVIDANFDEKSLGQRHSEVKRVLSGLAAEDVENITMLMMLSPEEAAIPDLMNLEFDDPSRSQL